MSSAYDHDSSNDEEDEVIMLDAAIRESLQSARPDRNGGAGSSKPNASSNSAAALRAAAAEKRLAHANQSIDVDDFQMASGTESEADSSEEEPLSKGKGKAKGKKTSKIVKIRDTTSVKFMSIAKQRAQDRKDARLAKKEERNMRKQLGRKLTRVNHLCVMSVLSFLVLKSSYRQKKPHLHCINITRSSGTFGETWKQLSK